MRVSHCLKKATGRSHRYCCLCSKESNHHIEHVRKKIEMILSLVNQRCWALPFRQNQIWIGLGWVDFESWLSAHGIGWFISWVLEPLLWEERLLSRSNIIQSRRIKTGPSQGGDSKFPCSAVAFCLFLCPWKANWESHQIVLKIEIFTNFPLSPRWHLRFSAARIGTFVKIVWPWDCRMSSLLRLDCIVTGLVTWVHQLYSWSCPRTVNASEEWGPK